MQVRTESTETIDGPNGMGSIETVSVSINGVSSMSAAQQQRVISQGELIRQEQRAGVVPVNRSGPIVVTSSSPTTRDDAPDTAMGEADADGASKDSNSEQSDDDMADDEEAPHARGPDLIGAADMGPQSGSNASSFSISHAGNAEVHGIDIEAAVGRKHESQNLQPDAVPPTTAAVATSESSDDAAVLTPSSSEAEVPVPKPESVEETVESEVKEEPVEIKEEEKDDGIVKVEGNEPHGSEDAAGSKSATMSARSSPVKREAEDDISEAESEPKRLKSSTLDHESDSARLKSTTLDHEDVTPSRSDGGPEGESEPAAPSEPAVKIEGEESASAGPPQPESTDETMEDSQGAGDSGASEKPIGMGKQADEGKKDEAAEPKPADAAD